MRINYLIPGNVLTGGVRVIFEIANRLSSRGHVVTITAPDCASGAFKFKGLTCTKRIPFYQKWITAMAKQTLPGDSTREMDDYFIESAIPDCDINVATMCTTTFPVYRSGKGMPYYHMQHYETLLFENPRMKRIAEETYYLPITKIANSKWLKEIIEEKARMKVPVIYPAIDHDVFYPRSRKKGDGRKRIVALGRKVKWKGTADLLDAVRIIRQNRSDVELILFGGEDISSEGTGVPFTFLSRITDENLAELYSTADVVVSPSWYESFPLPPLEAMACGAPVVTTRFGTEDYAIDEENCLVVAPREPKALANAILRVLDEEDLRERFARNGPTKAREFTWDKTVDSLESLWLR